MITNSRTRAAVCACLPLILRGEVVGTGNARAVQCIISVYESQLDIMDAGSGNDTLYCIYKCSSMYTLARSEHHVSVVQRDYDDLPRWQQG
jgi:hypothetical protein